MEKQFPSSRCASARLPAPMRMEASGAPPKPTRAANAEIIMMIGKVSPTPVKAIVPVTGMRPIYMRSTTL